MEAGNERGGDVAEFVCMPLNREQRGHGVGGPGADFDGVGGAEFCIFAGQAERLAYGATQLLPVEPPKNDVRPRQFQIVNSDFVATADPNQRAVRKHDYFVITRASATRHRSGDVVRGIEKILESWKFGPRVLAPHGGDGA